jgi:hypothetical protein
MATVLEKYTTKQQVSVVDERNLSRKAVHNWVQKRGKRFADDEEVETEVRKWLRRQSKDFYAEGFDAGKTMG